MSSKTAQLFFYGGTGSVTGAHFLLDAGLKRIVIDCGLKQSPHQGSDPNRAPFVYDPHSVDVLIITHAHMDHIGRVPKLVRDGFSGPIYSTRATKEIVELMYDDALSLMHKEQRESGIPLMYEKEDVERALERWNTVEYHESLDLGDGVSVRFLDAGHVLGSAMVELSRNGRTIVFSGDLGNSPAPILRDTEPLSHVHYLVMESVYGDRLHEHRDLRKHMLHDAIEATRKRKGVLMIPAFSLERTQILLYELHSMLTHGEIQPIDVYLDSPLASRVTEVYRRHTEYFNETAKEDSEKGDIFSFPGLQVTEHAGDSERIEDAPRPTVIIAGSGMSHGGRIQAHEQHFLSDKDATVLFVGYQAAGTLGRRIQEGERRVRIDGSWVRVNAHIETLHGYSAHKDRDGLLKVVEGTASSLEKVFVAMGEPKSSMFLAQRIRDFFGVDAIVPKEGDSFALNW